MTTPSWLTQARQVAATSLTDSAVVKRKTKTPDGMGGTTESWSDIATVACRIHTGGGGSGQYAGRIVEQETGTIRVTLPYDLPPTLVLSTADRLYVNGSMLLEITSMDTPKTYMTALVCSCKISIQ